QFERVLSPSGPYGGHLIRPSDGHEPKRIAWIQCVGSRSVERNWCSAVCCMHSTKQALIAQEHNPGTESTIFYIDYRAYGKGFEGYYERAKAEGVRYIRAMPSEIKQDPVTNNLEIHYSMPDGSHRVETFELVVLSAGLQAPSDAQRLAERLGLALTPEGFCETMGTAIKTTREGVFVCGAFAEPKDIPETIISASGAAAKAMTLLFESRYTLVQPREYPPERDVSGEEPRVGVFVCRCGSNIAGVVDVESVVDYAAGLKNVVYAEENMFTCSTDTQARIREAIEEHHLNRVVVASCTPRTHEKLFQSTIREAGLNFYLFEMANIRDQCSWVHRNYPDEATEKAEDLVRMAVAKARLLEPLQRKSMEFNHDALVIGGGLVGMAAALDLADQNFKVSLIERDKELGGNMRHLHYLLGGINPQEMLRNYVERTTTHPNIKTYLNAEVATFEGSLGKFQTTLKSNNGYDGQVIQHGVTIVATGARPYTPTEYLYGQDKRILTQMELEEQIAHSPDTIKKMQAIVMIQCVGGRNEEHPYCSRLCCCQAVKNALEIKKINPDLEVYILYRDLRTYGLMEKYYRQARLAEIVFLRFEDDRPPEVTADGSLRVRVHDAMLDTDIILDTDEVILSVATVPQADTADVAQLLKVPRTADGFFQEAHLKLAPVDFATDGIFLCGMAHYPKRVVTESLVQASAAASRASTILSKDVIEIEPTISHVIDEKCDGCAYCVDPCPFNAITLVEYEDEEGTIKKTVVVDEALCKGCGTCMATCPKAAIFVWHFKPEQLFAMTMAALEG
ncbi:MAG: FAD-dependent oxidoreductase, partial [Anaerolineae bacterium]